MDWKCDMCGRCCKAWDIQISNDDISRLEALGYEKASFVKEKKGKKCLRKRLRWCVFLGKDMKCLMQKRHGYDAKPAVCRAFPFLGKANQMVCGSFRYCGTARRASIDSGFSFSVGRAGMQMKVLLHAIRKLNSRNYAGMWGWIIREIRKRDFDEIYEHDIDGIASRYNGSGLMPTLAMKAALASLSPHMLYGLMMMTLKRPLTIWLPTGKFRLYPDAMHVRIREPDIGAFISMLSSGHGITRSRRFPGNLAFSLCFLGDFARSAARENGRKVANIDDIVNAYSKLNSIFRFQY